MIIYELNANNNPCKRFNLHKLIIYIFHCLFIFIKESYYKVLPMILFFRSLLNTHFEYNLDNPQYVITFINMNEFIKKKKVKQTIWSWYIPSKNVQS